jgi:uncharacterized protein (TIGR03086 family)
MTTTEATAEAPLSHAAPTVSALPDPRPIFATAVALCREVVAGVRPEQLDQATPCDALNVRTLGHHVLAVLERLAIVGAGGDPSESPDYAKGVADDEWVAVFDRFAAQIDAVWSDDAVLTNILTVPWAKLPGAVALLIYINEISVHTWDLATATGQVPAWDEGVLTTAYAAIQRGLPAEGRDNAELPFEEVVDVADDAPLIERLVAWNGRDPQPII